MTSRYAKVLFITWCIFEFFLTKRKIVSVSLTFRCPCFSPFLFFIENLGHEEWQWCIMGYLIGSCHLAALFFFFCLYLPGFPDHSTSSKVTLTLEVFRNNRRVLISKHQAYALLVLSFCYDSYCLLIWNNYFFKKIKII